MTIDIRDALHGIADHPPRRALADQANAAARVRRRRRFVGVPLAIAAALLVIAMPALVRQAQVALAPVSPTGTFRYDADVETPWPWLRDLPPKLDEPVAFTYGLNDYSDGNPHDRVVTVSGRQ